MAAAPPSLPTSVPLRGVQPLRAGEGHSFLLRRLHSLSGIVPIGAFLVEHILSNFEALNGPLAYAQQVKFLNSLPLVRVCSSGRSSSFRWPSMPGMGCTSRFAAEPT